METIWPMRTRIRSPLRQVCAVRFRRTSSTKSDTFLRSWLEGAAYRSWRNKLGLLTTGIQVQICVFYLRLKYLVTRFRHRDSGPIPQFGFRQLASTSRPHRLLVEAFHQGEKRQKFRLYP